MPTDESDSRDDEGGRTFTYDPGPDQPTDVIVRAVAWETGIDAGDLDPLAHAVNPDGLHALFGDPRDQGVSDHSSDNRSDDLLRLTFEYEGCLITLERGRLSVEPR